MKQLIHRVAGGMVALSGAVLLAFTTDESTRPTDWAVPAAVAFLVIACICWVETRPRDTDVKAGLRAADKATFDDLMEMIPRHVVDFLQDHDFGSAWRDRSTLPLYIYATERKAVEHQFHDEVLEEKRSRLHKAVGTFIHTLAGYSIPTGHDFFEMNEKEWVRSHAPGDETGERFQAHRLELNELADAIVEVYDVLIREARRRVP